MGHLLLCHQHTPVLEAPKLASSIHGYNTQVNTIKIASRKTAMCWGALLRDAGSLTGFVKPRVTFEGSRTEKQWPPYRRAKAKAVRDQCIYVGI